mmetsp:Transcript_18892/g.52516  ORF Transcript_18892/g.52516 Transcript_18892/m.52516 type:complete len:302 (+) Transcript_18892:533-1438(+)
MIDTAIGTLLVHQIDLGGCERCIHQRRLIHRGIHRNTARRVRPAVVGPHGQHFAHQMARDVDQEETVLFRRSELALVEIAPHERAARDELLGEHATVHERMTIDVDRHVEGIAVDGTDESRIGLSHRADVRLSQLDPILLRGHPVPLFLQYAITFVDFEKIVVGAMREVDGDCLELAVTFLALQLLRLRRAVINVFGCEEDDAGGNHSEGDSGGARALRSLLCFVAVLLLLGFLLLPFLFLPLQCVHVHVCVDVCVDVCNCGQVCDRSRRRRRRRRLVLSLALSLVLVVLQSTRICAIPIE